MTRRSAMRVKRSFPHGKFAALLTAAFVTLMGVYLQLEPLTILIRASVSAIVLGGVVSLGVSIVRLADAESKKHVGRNS
ncbi:MAG: hypothetical protein WBD20_16070 [Pirellulaceae bacterium]